MINVNGLESVVAQLRDQRTTLVHQLRHVDAALSSLGKASGDSFPGMQRRTMSAAARRKISLAQKARWAKRSSNGHAGAATFERTISVAGRKRIAAAQRARWAKVRQQRKAA
jgi:hypothetical protein